MTLPPDGPDRPPCGRRSLLARVAPVVLLAALIALVHGPAVRSGWFMDDWAHVRQLREADWTLRGLTDACRLELVGGVIDLWWLPETTLRFFRPVSFALMKLVYVVTGWSAAAQHVASLAWHTLACVLLYTLLRRMLAGSAAGAVSTSTVALTDHTPKADLRTLPGPQAGWTTSWPTSWAPGGLPLFVTGLFAIHPAHVGTVQWIACQTELMVTVFLLGATLCFAVFRGWAGFTGASAGQRRWAAGGAVLLMAAALGCRENAVMLPLVLAAVEPWAARGRRGRRTTPWLFFGLLLALVAGYGLLRTQMLAGAALPPRPYVITPGEPDFFRFVADKALYYVLCEFLLVPCVPIAGLPYLQERPALFYSVSVVLLLLLGLLLWRERRQPAGWLGVAWMLGFMAPVLPAFASPHHLYLPGIGWALLMARLLARCAEIGGAAVGGAAVGSVGVIRRRVALAGAGLLMAGFAVLSYFSSFMFDVAQRVEDQVVREVLSDAEGLRDGDTLYFLNLPMIAHYVRLAVEERGGLHDLRAVGLTWSPRILGMNAPAELTRLDERTLAVRIGGAERYFSGPFGQLIREARGGPLEAIHAREHPRGGCVVFLDERDDAGVEALRIVLDRPLEAPGVHVFWGSRAGWAQRISPGGP